MRITCAGTSKTASRPSLRATLDNHLPGLNDLTRRGAHRGHDAGRVSLEFGETHQIVRGFHLRFGGIDLRLSGLQRLLCLIVVGARGPALLEQRILALEMIARLRQLTL